MGKQGVREKQSTGKSINVTKHPNRLNLPAPRHVRRRGKVLNDCRVRLAPPSAMPTAISTLPAIPTAIAVIVVTIAAVARPGLTIVPAVPVLPEIPAFSGYRGAISGDFPGSGTAA